MAEAINDAKQVGRPLSFINEHTSLYAGGARVWSQNVLPFMFRTERYNRVFWDGGISSSNPDFDPETGTRRPDGGGLRIRPSQAWEPDQSAAYLGPIVAGYEAGIRGQTGSHDMF